MAVFGVQLAFSMILASIISKVGGQYSFARFLLSGTGLVRYLRPTDDQLRALAGKKKDGTGKEKFKLKAKDMENPDQFFVPKNMDIQLDSVKVGAAEVMHLRFYDEFNWLIDFSLYSTLIYVVTEVYYWLANPTNEMNLSVFWCLLSLIMCVRVLVSLTAVYFRGDEVMGERSMCLVMGVVYLLLAMIFLTLKEETLDVGVDSAYQSFHDNASEFLKTQGLPSSGPASKLIVKFCIAVGCGILGSFFTFPGIRMTKMFWNSRKYCEENLVMRSLVTVNFIMPMVLAFLWVNPIGREIFAQTAINKAGDTMMTDGTFDSMRLWLVVGMVVLRIFLMPWHLQAYLNIAQDNLNELTKEAGRTTNLAIQRKVTAVFYLLCMVALQYVAPVLLCLQCSLLYKTLGNGSWVGASTADNDLMLNATSSATFLPETDSLKPAAEHWAIALSTLKQVFNAVVFRGIFGFATWWCIFLLFASSGIGSLYLSYSTSG